MLQERHYYPFGMMYEGPFYPQVGPQNEYTYNDKRFHREGELNWYDYGARWYDPAVARWWNLDPLADQMRRHSPYNYAFDNPMRFIDPDGRNPVLPIAWAWTKRKLIFSVIKGAVKEVIRTSKAPIGVKIPVKEGLPSVVRDATTVIDNLVDPVILKNEDESIESSEKTGAIDWTDNPPATPDNLSEEWEDVTDERKRENTDNRDFENKETKEKITFDKGKEGKPGFEGVDHWHRHNPNSTGKKDAYLDAGGTPVPKGSKKSHITPKN